MPRNRLALFIGILRPWKQTYIELIGHFEAALFGKEWSISVFPCANGMFLTKASLEN